MYSVADYGRMIADEVRMDAYVEALKRAVRPGSVVVDIGTGTGIFALLACQFGAQKVYAIETNDAIQVGRELAAANGYAERIEFIQKLSTKVSLSQKVDVMISDMRGVLPWAGGHAEAIMDARRRFLAPGGIQIPLQDRLYATVVEAPDIYAKHTAIWRENKYGLDMDAACNIVTNVWGKQSIGSDCFLAEAQAGGVLDYTAVTSPNMHSGFNWQAKRNGVGHGLLVWFDATIAEGITFSNAPDAPDVIYGTAFFPWTRPVKIAEGDYISTDLNVDYVNSENIWRWQSCVFDSQEPEKVKAQLNQSTYYGFPMPVKHLRKRGASYVPSLNEDAKINLFVLQAMDGKTPHKVIAQRLLAAYPTQFKNWNEALARVGKLALSYSN